MVVWVALTGTVADVESVTEDAEETWVDALSGLGTVAGAELPTCSVSDVEEATGRGVVTWSAGAVGAWAEAEIGPDV